jgi:hypothetical protein
MINRLRKWKILLILMGIGYLYPQLADAGWEWRDKKELSFSDPVLDVSESLDGEWLFVLAPNEILIYSIPENKTHQRIPLDKNYDRLMHSSKNNTLILTSRSEKTVKIIQLHVRHEIDVSERPFIGAENSPLTLSVFFDYQ